MQQIVRKIIWHIMIDGDIRSVNVRVMQLGRLVDMQMWMLAVGAMLIVGQIMQDHSLDPEAMSIGQTTTGLYGHVFWVESVDADGINISEYNYNFSGDFYSRKIYFPEAYNYNYIHVKG